MMTIMIRMIEIIIRIKIVMMMMIIMTVINATSTTFNIPQLHSQGHEG